MMVFTIFIGSTAFEGPLRMVFIAAHLPTAIYLREVLAAGVVMHATLAAAKRNFPIIIIMTLMFVLHNCVGVWATSDIRQVLFGDKILLDGMFGLAIGAMLFPPSRAMTIFLIVILVSTDAGIIFNAVDNPLPWQNISFDLGGIQVSGIRTDYAGGLDRLAGFTRAYTTAAGIEVLVSITCIVLIESKIAQVAILSLCTPFLFLTNSKAAFGCLFVATIPFILGARTRGALKPLCVIAIALAVVVPLGFYGVVMHSPNASTFSLYSFVDRVNNSWPASWDLIVNKGSSLLGRGIGGIGSPQKVFAPALFEAGDNVFIMLYAYFGLFAVAYILYVLFLVARSAGSSGRQVDFAVMIITFVMSFGITGVVIEDQLMIFYLCAGIGLLYSVRGSRAGDNGHKRPEFLAA